MKKIEFKYSYHAWGFNKDETQVIDFEEKLYTYSDKKLSDVLPLPDDLLSRVESLFMPIYVEFPKSVFAFDAPMWTLTIDDKTCTRVADSCCDSYYKTVSEIFNAFKNSIK